MKNLILIIMLICSTLCGAQIAPPKQNITLNMPRSYNSRLQLGPGMMIGGAALFVAGVLTPPLMVGGSTTEKQPFYKQGARALSMVSGSLVFTIGVGITIANH